MEYSLQLRIGSIFVLFFASLSGIMTSLYGHTYFQGWMVSVVNALAAGVMLGLSLIHMIPEADEELKELVPDYPLAHAIAGLGIIIVLFIEQLTISFVTLTRKKKKELCNNDPGITMVSFDHDHNHQIDMIAPNSNDHDHQHSHDHGHNSEHDHGHGHCCDHGYYTNESDIEMSDKSMDIHNEDCGFKSCSHTTLDRQNNLSNYSKKECYNYDEVDDCDHNHNAALEDLMKAESLQDIISAYALEISTGVHSIIIGAGLGLLGPVDTSEIVILMIVLSFHQYVEGFGLGSVIHTARKSVESKIFWFITIFTCTAPLGVIIGIATCSDQDDDGGTASSASASCLAAGSMLYICLSEMVSHYFNNPNIQSKVWLKLFMLFSFTLGFAFMAVIGIWA